MNPKVEVVDEGDEKSFGVEEALRNGVGMNTIKRLVKPTSYLAVDELDTAVNRNENVIERALEEDVFPAKIRIPGWFVNNDEELTESFGSQHPGGTVEIYGLVEDYSEKAFRVVAKRNDELPGLTYDFEWTFLPKSVVTAIWLDGIDDLGDGDNVRNLLSGIRRRRDEDWAELSWEEMLERIDNEGI